MASDGHELKVDFEAHTPDELPGLRRMLQDYHEISSSEPVKKLIETVMDDALDRERSPFQSYEKLAESYYIKDLIEDLRHLRTVQGRDDLDEDLALHASDDGKFEFNYAQEYNTMSYYPRMEMNRSSVVVFPFTEISERVASFITNISHSYDSNVADDDVGKIRNIGSSDRRYRVSIIAVDNATQVSPKVQAIDFYDLHVYWGFLSAVTKAKTRHGAFGEPWTGPCHVDLHGSADDDNGKTFSSIFGSGQRNKQLLRVTEDSIILSENGRQVFELTHGRLVAMTLTSDWPRVKDYVLNVELGHQAYPEGVRVRLLDQTLEPVENSSFYHTELKPVKNSKPTERRQTFTNTPVQKVLLPVQFSEMSEQKTTGGLDSVALVQSDQSAAEKGKKSTIAIDNIPFVNMTYYHQGRDLKDGGEDGANLEVEPELRPVLYNSVTQRVQLSAAKAANKALEVNVMGADDLMSGSTRAPNVYCACYLIDTEGARIGASLADRLGVFKMSDGEWKTDVEEASRNPRWETKIMMQEDDEVGVSSNVSHVLIIFKDVQSKLRRPVHIGQVVVPMGCFLDGQAVPLTLPLEPAAKTPDSLAVSGLVHLAVRAVVVSDAPPPTSEQGKNPKENGGTRVKSMYRARHLSHSSHTGAESLQLSYSLKPAAVDALNVFWPFEVIGGGLGDARGHVACRRDGLVIDLAPGSGGVLANCIEASNVVERTTKRESIARQRTHSGSLSGAQMPNHGNKMIFTIEWESVESALAVTESSIVLTVVLHHDAQATGGRRRAPSIRKVTQEIVVAPCSARAVQLGIAERKNSIPIRKEMRAFQGIIAEESQNPGGQVEILDAGRRFMRELADMTSMELRMYQSMLADAHVREPMVKVVESEARSGASNSRWGAGRSEQSVARGVRRASTAAAVREILPRITSPGTMGGYEECLASARLRARANLYRVQLTELCTGLSVGAAVGTQGGAGTGNSPAITSGSGKHSAKETNSKDVQALRLRMLPEFSAAGTQALVDRNLEDIDFRVKDSAQGLTEELYLRHNLICNAVTDSLANYILCSGDADEETVLTCVKELIGGYYLALKDSFDEYLGSPDAFKRTPGQEAKIMLMQLVVTQNRAFEEIVAEQVYYLGYRLASPLRLLPQPHTPDDVVEWYKASLVQETQAWLAKTLSQAMTHKTNEFGLPWDYAEVGGQIVSAVPETVLTQLNNYLEVVTSTGKRFARAFDKEWRKYGREKRLRELSEGSDSDDEGDSEAKRERPARTRTSSGPGAGAGQSFNEEVYLSVTEAVDQCLVLLAGEYARMLKTKHWSRGMEDGFAGSGGEEEANFLFLVSVINDCHRVQKHEMHSTSMLQSNPEIVRLPGRMKVAEAFDTITDNAILNLVRIVFADVNDLVVDFPRLWATDSQVCAKLADCMSSYFQALRVKVEAAFMGEVVRGCSSVIVGCFMYMLTERVTTGPRLSLPELHRLQEDVCDAQDFFDKALGRELAPSRQSEAEMNYVAIPQMRDIGNALDLLGSPYPEQKDHMEGVVRQIAYHHELETASSLVEAAISLRPVDSASTKASVGEELIEMANTVLLTSETSPEGRQHGPRSRYNDLLLALLVQDEPLQLNQSQSKASSSSSSSGGSFTFKKLRERVSDLGHMHMSNTVLLKTKRQRLKILKAMDLLSDQALSEYTERTLTESSISTAGRADTFLLRVSRIEVKDVRTMSLFSPPNPYVYVKVGKDRKAKTPVSYGASAGYAHWPKCTLTVEVPRRKLLDGSVEIAVYDKEPIRRKRLMGKVEVRLAGLELHRIQQWFALSGGEYGDGEVFAVLDMQEKD